MPPGSYSVTLFLRYTLLNYSDQESARKKFAEVKAELESSDAGKAHTKLVLSDGAFVIDSFEPKGDEEKGPGPWGF